MDYGPNRPSCRSCGRPIDRGVAGGAGNCERCSEDASALRGAESRRRGIVERLRGRYAEAQEWVVPDSGSPSPHANLEWILGARRGAGWDGAALDASVSELVVLWLEDLAVDLERREIADSARGGEGLPARRAVAEELRIATRDFADAFLDSQADGCPS